MDSNFYRAAEWISRLFLLNILWVVFTIVGLGIFGFGPATAAMFAIVRKWIITPQEDFPLFKTFWENYKSRFIRANILTWMVALMGLVFYYDLRFFQNYEGILADILLLGAYGLMLAYYAIVVLIYPVFSHYEATYFQYIKNALFIAIAFPIRLLMMFLCLIAVFFAFIYFPQLFMFFVGSLSAFALMWISYGTFEKIEAKKNAYAQIREGSKKNDGMKNTDEDSTPVVADKNTKDVNVDTDKIDEESTIE
ncbi:MAG: YesL family protein [Firmicutes bacterium]|nr:YesL family protein [Bacillota bacterium]